VFSSAIFITENEHRFLEVVTVNVFVELLLYSRSDFSEVVDDVISEDIIIEEFDNKEFLGFDVLELEPGLEEVEELEQEAVSLVLDTPL